MSFGPTKLTHYEVLGVKQDCTQEQLKSAFLNLSKKYHPDINSSDTKLHNKFVKINEAYSVLRAADSRRAYDLQMHIRNNPFSAQAQSMRRASPYPFRDFSQHYREDDYWASQRYGRHQRFYSDPFIDPERFSNRRPPTEDAYYGFRGMRRQSNYTIMAGCLLFVVFGSIAQFFAVAHSSTLQRSLLTEQSDKRVIIYGQAKKTAEENGNEKQLEILAQNLGQDLD